MEGNLRFKIDWSSLIVEVNSPFLLCFTLSLRAIVQVQAPPPPPPPPPRRSLYLERRFNGGFFALLVWGAYIWRGLFSEFYDKVSYIV